MPVDSADPDSPDVLEVRIDDLTDGRAIVSDRPETDEIGFDRQHPFRHCEELVLPIEPQIIVL